MTIEVYNAVGGAAFFEGLIREWRAAGATVICHEAVAEAEYRVTRGPLGRAVLRGRMYLGQGWRCWTMARRRGAVDVRIVATNPFFAPALVARASGGRVPVVNLLYDLYPEALVQAGRLAADSWLARRGAALTRYALRSSAATVFLGDRLLAQTEIAHGPARRAVVIPVGADGEPYRDHPPQRLRPGETLRILYSGQLGRMHDVATLQAGWAGGGQAFAGVQWSFHASGAGYARLRHEVGSRPGVEWGGALADAAWQEAMKRAHVALVTMAPGAERVVMPSKTYSALVAGQAVLAICPCRSDLANLVRRHDCGWVIEPGDAAGLGELIRRLRASPDEVHAKRINAYGAGHEFYDVRPVGAQWLELLRDLARGQPGAMPAAPSYEAVA